MSIIPKKIRRKVYFERALQDTDIFLVGHPKSGNTWLACMLATLVCTDEGQTVNISNIGEYVPLIHNNDLKILRHPDLARPRIFRNEAPTYPTAYPRTVYIVRDPRAALLSYYHHCVHDTGRTDWDIDLFIDEMLTVGCIKTLEPQLVRWDIQVEKWFELQKTQDVIFVRYEDLKEDCHASLRKIDTFLGLHSSDQKIDDAVEQNSFGRMRKDESQYGSESFSGEKGAKGFFVRKGKVDSWKEEIPPDTIRKIEEAYGSLMKKLDYL